MPLKRSFKALTAAAIILLTGCVGYSPNRETIGQNRASLIAYMSLPEREYPTEGMQVLHFPRSPSGSDTYFVYVDNQARVVKWEQVLTEERFDTIAQGITKDQVIERIGITKITHGLARGRGYVWHYRYTTPHCKSFVIEFTPEDIVRSAGYRIRSGRFCKYVGMG